MTQTEISKKLNISQQYVSMIISGKRRPSWDIAKKFAELTGTTASFWMEAKPDVMKDIIKNNE